MGLFFFFFKQKTAYELRISDWSSDVCSSDLRQLRHAFLERRNRHARGIGLPWIHVDDDAALPGGGGTGSPAGLTREARKRVVSGKGVSVRVVLGGRSIIKKKKPDKLMRRHNHYRDRT